MRDRDIEKTNEKRQQQIKIIILKRISRANFIPVAAKRIFIRNVLHYLYIVYVVVCIQIHILTIRRTFTFRLNDFMCVFSFCYYFAVAAVCPWFSFCDFIIIFFSFVVVVAALFTMQSSTRQNQFQLNIKKNQQQQPQQQYAYDRFCYCFSIAGIINRIYKQMKQHRHYVMNGKHTNSYRKHMMHQ